MKEDHGPPLPPLLRERGVGGSLQVSQPGSLYHSNASPCSFLRLYMTPGRGSR